MLGKMKMIGPMLWPRGSILLQLCVIASALLLVLGRVCNLFVPIYYKKIGKNLVYSLHYYVQSNDQLIQSTANLYGT